MKVTDEHLKALATQALAQLVGVYAKLEIIKQELEKREVPT